MRPSVLFLLVLFVAGAATQAGPLIVRHEPIVVYEGRSTMPAQTFYKRLQRKAAGSGTIETPDDAGVRLLEDSLPLSPTQLRVGRPELTSVPGLVTPLFVMGMDEVSLNWFSRAAEGLADLGARGLVVQADNRTAWQALKARAQDVGIDLMLLAGDSLAEGYGIDTYPMVLMSPALAGQGTDE